MRWLQLLTTFLFILFPSLAQHLVPLEQKSTTEFMENVLESNQDQKYCNPSGIIQDARCDFETVESVNQALFDQLNDLVKTNFFRFFKVNLGEECPFWNDDGACANRACVVEPIDEESIPEPYRSRPLNAVQTACSTIPELKKKCEVKDQDFCLIDSEFSPDGIYVDLMDNPERFTGYAGISAARVWQSIYQENCFNVASKLDPTQKFDVFAPAPNSRNQLQMLLNALPQSRDPGDEDVCLEKRVFYRLISGLHASISIHICDEYLDPKTKDWRPNLECFVTRIGSHPERLQNVYFNYVILLRAVAKAANALRNFEFCSTPDENSELVKRVSQLVKTIQALPQTFDEKSMFTSNDAESLKAEFKQHFRNVSRIMDCVGCDKCKLWGKVQTTGLGTALKILFSYENEPEQLHRQEVVGLINTLHRFSESLRAVERFRNLYQENKRKQQLKKQQQSKKQQLIKGKSSEPTATIVQVKSNTSPTKSNSSPRVDEKPSKIQYHGNESRCKDEIGKFYDSPFKDVARKVEECCRVAVKSFLGRVMRVYFRKHDEF